MRRRPALLVLAVPLAYAAAWLGSAFLDDPCFLAGGERDRIDYLQRWLPPHVDCRITEPGGATRIEQGSAETFLALFGLALVLAAALIAPHAALIAPHAAAAIAQPPRDATPVAAGAGVPMFRGGPAHSGPWPAGKPVVRWSVDLGSLVLGSPAVVDGVAHGANTAGVLDAGAGSAGS